MNEKRLDRVEDELRMKAKKAAAAQSPEMTREQHLERFKKNLRIFGKWCRQEGKDPMTELQKVKPMWNPRVLRGMGIDFDELFSPEAGHSENERCEDGTDQGE